VNTFTSIDGCPLLSKVWRYKKGVVSRNQWRTANAMGKRKRQKDKQLSTKYYTEN